jgi:hypothetical protein
MLCPSPYNTLFNIPHVFTPDDKAIQTPNSDTPYSWIGLDLRAEFKDLLGRINGSTEGR